jgi:hypothetical protein
MKHRTGPATATAVASIALLGVCTPAFAATASSVTVKDRHDDAITRTGDVGSAKLDIYNVTGAKVGTDIRLTMTVRSLPADIADADLTSNHIVMGVATPNAGSGYEPTPNGRVRTAGGGDVCKGSTTTYNFATDTVKMVLPLRCVGGGTAHQVISGFSFRGDVRVDATRFSSEFSTR